MSDWEIVRHQVAIAGRVTDLQTGQPIGGAQVEITDAPAEFKTWLAMRAIQYGDRWAALAERPDRTRTAADSHYHFLDLLAGQYTLVASLPGAGTRYGQSDEVKVTVSQDKDGKYTLDPAELELPPTTVQGRVTDQKRSPVAMAQVRVVGSGERTYSDTANDTKGHYRLTGLEAGDRTVVASAQGYWELPPQPVQVKEAEANLLNLTLTPTTEPEPKPAPELAPPPILAALSKPAPLPEFKPTQIPGCQLWLTAEAVTGLRDGDPLAVWPDRSGYDHHAVQTEKQKRPTYQAQGIGRQPAVRFAGADDSMTLEFSEPSTDHTFFFAYDQPTPGKHNNFLFDAQAGRLTLDSAQAASPHRIRWQDSIWHSVAEAMTGPQILTWVFSSTTEMAEVLRNGTSLGTDDYIPRSLAGKITLGPNRSDQYSRLAGSMAAVIYYNRALTPEERQQVEQYLSKRFGISFD